MPRILITGNGFDLSFGLPTRYSDFINVINYLKNNKGDLPFEKVYENVDKFSRDKLINDIEPFDFDLDKIETIRQIANDNIWFNYFLNEVEAETWIDLENKIEFALKISIGAISKFRNEKFNGLLGKTPTPRLVKKDLEVLEANVLPCLKLIHKVSSEFYINTDYLIERDGRFIDVDSSKYYQNLIEHLNDFKKLFSLYLETFVVSLYDKIKLKHSINFINKLDYHFTFNYTSTFENLIGISGKIKFLHGKVDSNTNKIVLGVNEVSNDQGDKKYLLPFIKKHQSLSFSTDYFFLYDVERLDNDIYFYVFGCSIDKSDKAYFDQIFDVVKRKSGRVAHLTIIYHTEKSKEDLISNLFLLRSEDEIMSLCQENKIRFVLLNSDEYAKAFEYEHKPSNIFEIR